MFFRFAIAIACSLILYTSTSSVQITTQNINKKINTLVQEVDPQLHWGAEIVSLKTGKRLFTHNNMQLFTPASTMKLFTGAAVLSVLGPQYTFTTSLATDGARRGKELCGNLFVIGSGDPSFKVKHLYALIIALKKQGITKINGDVIIDASVYDEQFYGPGWAWDDVAYIFNSPISATNVQHNGIKISIDSTMHNKIQLEPLTQFVKLDTKLSKGSGDRLQVTRNWMEHKNSITIQGDIVPGSPKRVYKIAVENPIAYFGVLVKEALAAQGIVCTGLLKKGKASCHIKVLAEHASSPMAQLVRKMLKKSDNLYAECLYKLLGFTRVGLGTWASGKEAMQAWIESSLGIFCQNYYIVDGSGMSRYNVISPAMVVALLKWAYANPHIGRILLDGLPHAGIDGTLEKRFNSFMDKKNIRAKTGTMRGVSALSGYVIAANNEIFAFSIIMNNFVKKSELYKDLEEAIVSYLAAVSVKS